MDIVKLERISDMLRSQVESGAAVGCSAYVLRHGRPIYRANAGMADAARGIKWTNDTIVRLYSMTKPVTAAAAMILLDRGQLDLFDKVSWYIPGFRNQTVLNENGREPVRNEVCIKDLLDMTSGLAYPDRSYPAGAVMQDLYDKICEEVAAGHPTNTMGYANRIGQQPLAFQPGEKWMYGSSADVLGAVIEAVSGKKFGDFLRDELFEPLGMVDTDFWVPEEKLGRFAENYEERDGKLVPCLWQHLGLTYLCRKPPEFQSGGAGLCSTMDDYAAFAEMLLNDLAAGSRPQPQRREIHDHEPAHRKAARTPQLGAACWLRLRKSHARCNRRAQGGHSHPRWRVQLGRLARLLLGERSEERLYVHVFRAALRRSRRTSAENDKADSIRRGGLNRDFTNTLKIPDICCNLL